MVLVEITFMRQYIGVLETIFYFWKRQGGSISRMNVQTIRILRIFWVVHLALLIILGCRMRCVELLHLHYSVVTVFCEVARNHYRLSFSYPRLNISDDLAMPTAVNQIHLDRKYLQITIPLYWFTIMTNFDDRWHGRGGGGWIGGETTGAGGQQSSNPSAGWLYPHCPLLYCKVRQNILMTSWSFDQKTLWSNLENHTFTASFPLWKLFSRALNLQWRIFWIQILLELRKKFSKFS